MGDDKAKPQEIFINAIEIESAEKRQVFLDRACKGDDELLAKVEGLIRAYQAAGNFLEKPIAQFQDEGPSDYWDAVNETGAVTTHSEKQEDRPTDIGPFKLLQLIGEGGMGSVYMAQQEKPVKRRVALKVIKAGMDSKQVIARFEAERQALAMMDHPNIARLLDVGTTDTGRPYFVMELVKGIPITEYCDQKRLNVAERLELFTLVCNAVQHAHQKGIIHRDLKPSNILVTEYDETIVPKIIDFGLAKALGHGLTDKTMFTQFGQVMGTLAYMSPEQSKVNALDVDTRADVYSLGVLLYELLTGSTPFDESTFRDAALDQVLKVIREETPPKPSTRLSSDETSTQVAPNRSTDTTRLGKLVRGDLDWIVMKALEKERSRRYETANAFADDIDRYLNNEVIIARPPTAGYRFNKFVNKHRGLVAASTIIAVLLVAGIAGTSIGWYRTQAALKLVELERIEVGKEKDRANKERDLASEQRDLASEQRERADRHLARALAAVDKMLTRVGNRDLVNVPQMSPVRKRLLNDALAFYQEFLDEEIDNSSIRVRTAMAFFEVGKITLLLGNFPESERAHRKAIRAFEELSNDQPQQLEFRLTLAQVQSNLGVLMMRSGNLQSAAQHQRTAIDLWNAIDQKEGLDGESKNEVAEAYGRLGLLLRMTSRFKEARAALQQSVSIRDGLVTEQPESPIYWSSLASACHNLGALVHRMGDPVKADQLFRRALELRERTLAQWQDTDEYRQSLLRFHSPEQVDGWGSQSEFRQDLGRTYNSLGIVARDLGNMDEEISCYRKAVEIKEKTANLFPHVPEYQLELTSSQGSYAFAMMNRGQFDEADDVFQSAIARMRKLIEQNPKYSVYKSRLGAALHNRAVLMNHMSKFLESKTLLEEAIELQVAALAENPANPSFRRFLTNHYQSLAFATIELGELDAAAGAAIKFPTLFPDNFDNYPVAAGYLATVFGLAKNESDRDKYRRSFAQMLEEIERRLGENPNHFNALAWLLVSIPQEELRDAARAIQLSKKAIELDEESSSYWNTLGLAYYRGDDFDNAIESLERSLKLNADAPVFDFLFLAMAHSKRNEQLRARDYYDKAIDLTLHSGSLNPELQKFFDEAEALIDAE